MGKRKGIVVGSEAVSSYDIADSEEQGQTGGEGEGERGREKETLTERQAHAV